MKYSHERDFFSQKFAVVQNSTAPHILIYLALIYKKNPDSIAENSDKLRKIQTNVHVPKN